MYERCLLRGKGYSSLSQLLEQAHLSTMRSHIDNIAKWKSQIADE